jgi:hypothetical protein
MNSKFCTWPASFLLAATLSAGAATTSGPIGGSEIWSNSVYLTGDVTITPTGSLTILPGTRIEADPRADDQLGGTNDSRIELIVDQGVFSAVGTELNPIVFTTGLLGANPPATGDWYGIRVNSTNATLRNCIVEFGDNGLRVEGGTCSIDHCKFSNNKTYGAVFFVSGAMSDCLVTQNGYGNGDASGGVQIAASRPFGLSNCIVRDNSGPGIYRHPDQDARITIVNSTISGNGPTSFGAVCGTTVYMSGSSVVNNRGDGLWFRTGTITNCYIAANSGSGVFGFGPGATVVTDSRINNNEDTGVGGGGYSPPQYSPLIVSHSEVVGNAGDGIGVSGGWVPNTIIVHDSVVANNGLVGIHARGV